MKDLKKLREQFEIIKEMSSFENGFEDLEELQYEVEMELIYIDDTRLKSFKEFYELKNEILDFIEENTESTDNHYDAEAELDWMFPNRHDKDFDYESMSYESVFGSD